VDQIVPPSISALGAPAGITFPNPFVRPGGALPEADLAVATDASYSSVSFSGVLAMWARVVVAIILLLLPAAAFAQAEKRVALVIGNSAYQHTPKLANPTNDAADMAAALKKHGFKVIEGFDLDKPAFDRKVRDFATTLKQAEAGVFFYAGHGLQVAGQNYLVPIDAKAEGIEALDFEMVRVDVIHRLMENQTNTNILFLDACRDNPLARNLARSMGTRSSEIGRGLAQVQSGVGTLISFSTQPGNVALDGSGRNSSFAGRWLGSYQIRTMTLVPSSLPCETM
jgi:caspase domain-containing protein